MSIKGVLLLAAACLVAAVAAPSAAVASKRVSVVPTSGQADVKVTVLGEKLPKKRVVRIYALGERLGKVKTSRKGSFKRSVMLPSSAAGTLKLRVYVGNGKRLRRYTLKYTVLDEQVPTTTTTTTEPATSSVQTVTSPTTTSEATTTETSGDPVVVAAGDIACEPGDAVTSTACRQADTADLAASANPAGVLLLGDNQYENGVLSDYQGSFDLSWGQLTAPIYPAPGNHEYANDYGVGNNAQGYFDYFGDRAGDPAKGYYSFDIGDWHLIALNTNLIASNSSTDCFVISCNAGSDQEQWLRDDLAAHTNMCTLAYWHHPRFSSASHGNYTTVTALWTALYEGGADLVLNGHDHSYERFAPQDPLGVSDSVLGIREFVVGTGGKSEYGLGTLQPNSEVFGEGSFGVLALTLHASSYDWNFLGTSDSSLTDSGTASCH